LWKLNNTDSKDSELIFNSKSKGFEMDVIEMTHGDEKITLRANAKDSLSTNIDP